MSRLQYSDRLRVLYLPVNKQTQSNALNKFHPQRKTQPTAVSLQECMIYLLFQRMAVAAVQCRLIHMAIRRIANFPLFLTQRTCILHVFRKDGTAAVGHNNS